MTIRKLTGFALSLIISLATAFFGVFNVLFSDSSGPERMWAVVFIFVVYLFWSWLWYRVWPAMSWVWVYWLAVPAEVLGGIYMLQEFSSLLWYGLSVLLAVVAGAVTGRKLAQRRRAT